MNKDILPIIASYWGCECSYFEGLFCEETVSIEINGGLLELIDTVPDYLKSTNLKLHLRPLWSITEDELRELGSVLYGESNYSVEYYDNAKLINCMIKDVGDDEDDWMEVNTIQITNDMFFSEAMDLGEITKTINHLRKKSFCVDEELVNAGLVQWKEAEQ